MRTYITVWKEEDQVKYKFTGTQADQRSCQREVLSEKHQVLRNEEVDVPVVKERLLGVSQQLQRARAAVIVTIRGTSGSGKTYVVQQVMQALAREAPPSMLMFPLLNKHAGYLYPRVFPDHGVAIIGRYETACGGCDAYSWRGAADDICSMVRGQANAKSVLFEGLMVSAWGTDRWLQLSRDCGGALTVIHLTTPLEECLASVQRRREERARAKGQEAAPLNPQNTTAKWHGLLTASRKQERAGLRVEHLDRGAALARTRELLGIA